MVAILRCLREVLRSGLLFFSALVAKLSYCLRESCIMVMLLNRLHKAPRACGEALVFLYKVVVKF